MKPLIASLSLAIGLATVLTTWPVQADAKRIGGGKAVGMQRQSTPAPGAQPGATPGGPAQNAAPSQAPTQAAAATAGGAAAAAAPKRSWMGPLAGLAAGIGLAALFSHLGMGEALANIVTMLLVLAVVAVVGLWLMRRFMGKKQAAPVRPAFAGAGAAPGGLPSAFGANPTPAASPVWRSATPDNFGPATGMGGGAPAGAVLTPGLNLDAETAEGLSRMARTLFIRLQAANDAADLDDLRKFTTAELFASLRLDLLDRGSASQQTEVLQLTAQVVDVAQEQSQQVVSVHFAGLIRESAEAAAEAFAEVWHLVQTEGGEWRIAGITPQA